MSGKSKFSTALGRLQHAPGMRARRGRWDNGTYVFVVWDSKNRRTLCMMRDGVARPWVPNQDDMFSDDWEVTGGKL